MLHLVNDLSGVCVCVRALNVNLTEFIHSHVAPSPVPYRLYAHASSIYKVKTAQRPPSQTHQTRNVLRSVCHMFWYSRDPPHKNKTKCTDMLICLCDQHCGVVINYPETKAANKFAYMAARLRTASITSSSRIHSTLYYCAFVCSSSG